MTGMKILLAVMAALEITDGVFTHYAAGNGMVREGNALMESLVMNGDFLLLKIIGALLCVILLGRLYRRFPGTAEGDRDGGFRLANPPSWEGGRGVIPRLPSTF